jgi:hypothetical protein
MPLTEDVYLQPTQYAIAGATAIPCTKWSRRVEIAEDGAVVAFSGLSVLFPNGVRVGYSPEQQPVVLTDKAASSAGQGRIVARPANTGYPPNAADVYCVISPLGAATVINVWEYD